MSLDASLQEVCGEWRRLAEAEGEGIRAGDWLLVAECQSALRQLQSELDSRKAQATTRWSSEDGKQEQAFRDCLSQLLELEKRNLTWIAERRRQLNELVEQATLSSRNLRLIQRSYASDASTELSLLT
jgi:hypothetical protein